MGLSAQELSRSTSESWFLVLRGHRHPGLQPKVAWDSAMGNSTAETEWNHRSSDHETEQGPMRWHLGARGETAVQVWLSPKSALP